MQVLYNEAERQRTIKIIDSGKGWGLKEKDRQWVDQKLKIHGPYTEGFYEEQLDNLFKDVKNAKSS